MEMIMIKYLQAVNLTDVEAMIRALQKLFNKINKSKTNQAFELVSLYSTVSILEVNGLDKKSVKIIKRAIKSKVDSLYSQYPNTMREAKSSLDDLVSADID